MHFKTFHTASNFYRSAFGSAFVKLNAGLVEQNTGTLTHSSHNKRISHTYPGTLTQEHREESHLRINTKGKGHTLKHTGEKGVIHTHPLHTHTRSNFSSTDIRHKQYQCNNHRHQTQIELSPTTVTPSKSVIS